MKLILIILFLFTLTSCKDEIIYDIYEPNINQIDEYINVYISGEINIPGIYTIKKDKLINDLIELAGGLTVNANSEVINFVRPLYNNEMIIIPRGNIINLLNINKATKQEFDSIPGISSTVAEAIINYRNEIKAFLSLEDLKNFLLKYDVDFEEIREYFTV